VIADILLEKNPLLHLHSCDVSDGEQVKPLEQSTLQLHGRLEFMFSNPGVCNSIEQGILEFDMTAFEQLFAINVQGLATCVRHGARATVDGG